MQETQHIQYKPCMFIKNPKNWVWGKKDTFQEIQILKIHIGAMLPLAKQKRFTGKKAKVFQYT